MHNSVHAYLFTVVLSIHHTACERLGLEKTKDMGLYLPDRCKLFDDEEVTDKEIVGENPPPLQTIPGISI